MKTLFFIRCTVFFSAMLFSASASFALNPTKSLYKYGIDKWDPPRGFTTYSINAIFQTRDNYLWLATD